MVPAREKIVFELDLGDYLAQIFSNCAEQTLWSLWKEHENGKGRKGQPYSGWGKGEGATHLPYLSQKDAVGKAFSRAFECKNLSFVR